MVNQLIRFFVLFFWPALIFAFQLDANVLGWVPTHDIHNRCDGYYVDILPLPLKSSSIRTAETNIVAKKSTLFSHDGIAILEEGVKFSQPGREITAAKAFLKRDKKTGTIQNIQLQGNVHVAEAGRLLVAQKIDIEFALNHMRLEHLLYRINKTLKGDIKGNAWGTANTLTQNQEHIFNFYKASYSTCSPLKPSWHLKANKILLNTDNGRGYAFDSLLYIRKQPIFYFPFFSFPLDSRRKSGFLLPTFNYSNQEGGDITLPFYWNVAANKDVVLSPRFMTRRGTMLSAVPRYLDKYTTATANINFLPNDNLFHNFRQSSLQSFSTIPDAQYGLSRLQSAKSNRLIIGATEKTTLNSNWSINTNINYASDDYVFLDLDNILGLNDTVHLPNQMDLHYDSNFWHMRGSIQTYQNLHPVTEVLVPDLYSRLPEFNFAGFSPYLRHRLIYRISGEFVHFAHRPNFITNLPIVTGERFHIRPELELPLHTRAAFLKPKMQIDTTIYNLNNQALNQPNNINRVLPIFAMDSGVFFDRSLTVNHHEYHQTLEPRLFYLYVPKRHQQNIPIFDTVLPPFDFWRLFRINRFSSYDRFGDANQVSLALSSRILDNYSAEERLRLSLGEIYYINPYKICITPNCSDDQDAKNRISPLIAELQFNIVRDWDVKTSLALDSKRFQSKNAYVNLLYQKEGQTIGSLGYSFIRDGDILAGRVLGDLQRINLGVAWPLTIKWNLLGNWNYNLSWHQPQSYYYGAEYNDCCLALRFIFNRRFNGMHANTKPQFERKFYFQLQLKGLSNIGNNNPGNLLVQTIPEYQDNFAG